MDKRTFKIVISPEEQAALPHCPTELPYALVAEHERQIRINTGRTVQDQATTGLSPTQLYWALADQPEGGSISPDVPAGFLASLVEAWRRNHPAQNEQRTEVAEAAAE